MTWNNRVIKRDNKLGIHEVYYSENDEMISWTIDSIIPGGETIEDLKEELQRFMRASKKPILIERKDKFGNLEVINWK
jgi:hypothetical protein